jgi:hypothetical protein
MCLTGRGDVSSPSLAAAGKPPLPVTSSTSGQSYIFAFKMTELSRLQLCLGWIPLDITNAIPKVFCVADQTIKIVLLPD